MNRREKEFIAKELREMFTENAAAFLIGIEGLKVGQMQALRRGLRQKGGSMRVAKNTILRLATDSLECAIGIEPFFEKQIAIVFAKEDSPGVARIIYDASKNDLPVAIVAGCVDGVVVNKERIEFLAQLPSREQILAQLCGGLNAPIVSFVFLFNQMIVGFLVVLKKASEKGV